MALNIKPKLKIFPLTFLNITAKAKPTSTKKTKKTYSCKYACKNGKARVNISEDVQLDNIQIAIAVLRAFCLKTSAQNMNGMGPVNLKLLVVNLKLNIFNSIFELYLNQLRSLQQILECIQLIDTIKWEMIAK